MLPIVLLLVSIGCSTMAEWANAPESNRLANGRCRNPNDATTTIECVQQPPPTARTPKPNTEMGARERPPSRKNEHDPGREEVLAKVRDGEEEQASKLFWALPQDARTTKFASLVTAARVERIKDLESTPRDVAEAVASLKLDALPGDREALEALAGRVDKALVNLARRPADSANFRRGANMVEMVRDHSSEMAGATATGLSAFEERYGPVLVSGGLKDEDDWRAFVALYPESKYAQQLEENIAQLDQAAAIRASTERREREAAQLWEEVQRQGDNLAELSFKIAFAQKYVDPRRARIGLRNMRIHQEMLINDFYCPAKKEFVGNLGAAEFSKRAAAHCKDEPPMTSGLNGVEVKLTNECRAAFATVCSR